MVFVERTAKIVKRKIKNFECLHKQTLSSSVNSSEDHIIKEAADIIRKAVKDKIKKTPDLNCPPTVEQLDVGDRNPPEIFFNFYNRLLFGYETHHACGEQTLRIVKSLADYVMHSVSRGKYCTYTDHLV